LGELFVSVRPASNVQRIAIMAVLFAALGLSACGRKGALDAPPAALNNANAGTEVPAEESGTLLRPGTDKTLPIIRGPNKRIPLDVLLD
jgi:predicted small lipoprotein YifL